MTCSFAIELKKNKSPFKKYLNCEGTRKITAVFFYEKEGETCCSGNGDTEMG